MPIDFPNNPISGQTYSYNSITWEYNGVAWDKQGGGGSVGPQGNTGATGATGPQGNTGATGPVGDYVISIRGLTGAVGITNGSGIGLSVSGQTLTFSNTGVLSIDGGTGAVTNVARTNVANNFTALQSFSSGISASGSTFAFLATAQLRSSNLSNPFPLLINNIANSQTFIGDADGFGLNSYILVNDDNGEILLNAPVSGVGIVGFPGCYLGVGDKAYFSDLEIDGTTASFSGLISANKGISSAGGTFSALTRFTAGISASGGMTLAGSFQGSTATFRNGNVTINQTTPFGITESNNLFAIQDSNSSFSKSYSSYSSASTITNQPICSIYSPTGFGVAPVGNFKVTIKNQEDSGSNSYINRSDFVITNGTPGLAWTEIQTFNGLNRPVYGITYGSNYITVLATQTVNKLGGTSFKIEIEELA